MALLFLAECPVPSWPASSRSTANIGPAGRNVLFELRGAKVVASIHAALVLHFLSSVPWHVSEDDLQSKPSR